MQPTVSLRQPQPHHAFSAANIIMSNFLQRIPTVAHNLIIAELNNSIANYVREQRDELSFHSHCEEKRFHDQLSLFCRTILVRSPACPEVLKDNFGTNPL